MTQVVDHPADKTTPRSVEKPRSIPKELDTRFVSVLLSISKSTRALTGLKLAELGFYNGQDELLMALDEREPVAVSMLAEALNVRPSTVSKMMDRLVDRGMIERATDLRDGRRTMVHITPAGAEARTHLFDLREKLDAELTAACPKPDLMIETLETVAAALRKRLMRVR